MSNEFEDIIKQHIDRNNQILLLASSDTEYIEYLANQNRLDEAKLMLRNVKSVAKSLNEKITETEKYLKSFEG